MAHRVLLVDDDPNLLDGLRRALHKEQYEIVCATSAEQALGILDRLSVDAIVSDELMPGMSGTALLTKVRGLYPDVSRFMLTGNASLAVAVQAINEAGVVRFFMKPCNPTDLAFCIHQELEKRDLALAARGLLRKVKRQSAVIEQLERTHPQISMVRRDVDGAVLLEESTEDVKDLISEMCRQVDGE
jgi:DNA-binding NtrC family response regulator